MQDFARALPRRRAMTEPERAIEKFNEFVKLGLEVADRTKLWTE